MKRLFTPPQLQSEKLGTQERHATWLELFYDLAYVTVIAVLVQRLSHHLNPDGLLEFVILFVPIWHSWVKATLYADRFDTDDLIHQLLTLVQMIGIAGLAVFSGKGLIDGLNGYIISYAIIQGTLIAMNIDAGKNNKVAWKLTNRYAIGQGISLVFWLIALKLPAPVNFWIAGSGFLIDYITPFTVTNRQIDLPVHVSHLPERFGLFSIIVFGEIITEIVLAVGTVNTSGLVFTAGILAMVSAFCLWWIYFQNINARSLLKKAYRFKKNASRWCHAEYRRSVLFIHAHLPLSIAITITAVGIKHIISHYQHPNIMGALLFVGGLNSFLLIVGLLEWMTYSDKRHLLDRVRLWLRIISAGLIISAASTSLILHPVLLLAIITFILTVQLSIELIYQYFIYRKEFPVRPAAGINFHS